MPLAVHVSLLALVLAALLTSPGLYLHSQPQFVSVLDTVSIHMVVVLLTFKTWIINLNMSH